VDEVAILRDLVEAYSPSGDETAAVERFVRIAKALGFHATVDNAGNGIAHRGTGRPEVLYLGHIDTVEGELPVRVVAGRLYGRGAVDAKGPLAAALLAASSYDGPGKVTIVAAVGEERDSRGSRFLLTRPAPDFMIIGEPGGWRSVTIGYKGNLSLVLRFAGKRSHLSSPSPTTVDRALDFASKIRAFCEVRQGASPFHSLSAKVHTIDTRREGDAETVEVGVNLRLPPAVTTAEVLRFIEEDQVADSVVVVDRSEAIEVNPRNDVVRTLCAEIRRHGGEPTLRRKLGTSDMNLTVPRWECPAAAYGPGDSHLSHTDRECLDIEDLRKAVEVLHGAFSALTSAEQRILAGVPKRRPSV